MTILLVIGYILGAVLVYGYTLALWQRNYSLPVALLNGPSDTSISIIVSIIWPISFPVVLFSFRANGLSIYKGFLFRPLKESDDNQETETGVK